MSQENAEEAYSTEQPADQMVPPEPFRRVFFNEEIAECQHDCVATVKVVPTHVVRASDGEASSCNHLHDSPHLGLPVTKQLRRALEMHSWHRECGYVHGDTPV